MMTERGGVPEPVQPIEPSQQAKDIFDQLAVMKRPVSRDTSEERKDGSEGKEGSEDGCGSESSEVSKERIERSNKNIQTMGTNAEKT